MGIRYRTLSVSLRYDTVLFPFESLLFLQSLADLGYAFPEPQQPPLGGRVDVGGVLGRKGGVAVHLNIDKMVLGVSANDPQSLLTEFDAVERIVSTQFGIQGETHAKFYELLAGMVVDAGKPPLEVWEAHRRSIPLADNLSSILGTEMAPFGLRVSPIGKEPNRAEWFDVKVEPDVQTNCRAHTVEIVYRKPDRSSVMAFTASLERTVMALIEAIEK
jgi:hypothetical protein